MRPVATREARPNMAISRIIRAGLDLIYFGKAAETQKKIVVTTITWVEGKDGSPEPSGRVGIKLNLSGVKNLSQTR